MILEAITIGALVSQWLYHRLFDEIPEDKPQERRFRIPRVDNGAPIGLVYGRTRVRDTLVSWVPTPGFGAEGYTMQALLTLGIPFEDGTQGLHGMWIGDDPAFWDAVGPSFPLQTFVRFSDTGGWFRHGTVEFLSGSSTQMLVDDSDVAQTATGALMLASGLPASSIHGYRGVLAVGVFGDPFSPDGLVLGNESGVPSFSFEASSYKAYSFLASAAHAQIDDGTGTDDANPICVLYSLLTDVLGKGAIASSYIDEGTFRAAAFTCASEGLGFSGVLDGSRPLAEHVMDVLRHVDGILYLKPDDQKLYIKLVRNDYSLAGLTQLNKTNTVRIENFSMTGQQGIVNQLRLVYMSRAAGYQERDVVARNGANAVGQAGQVIETVIRMPYISNATTAYRVALRELAARCRPNIKLRAIVDRSFYSITPGTPVALSWTNPDLSNLVFRVARVDYGTLDDGQIALDLILDMTYINPRTKTAEPVFDSKSTGGRLGFTERGT